MVLYNLDFKPWTLHDNYFGMQLTHDDKGTSTLGSEKLTKDYRNTNAFIHQTDLAKQIDDLLMLPLTMTRSRIAMIDGNVLSNPILNWHTDESPEECIRLNVPIQTHRNFLFQLEGEDPVHFEEGVVYWWDTSVPHRVFHKKKVDIQRIHLVLGFNPWYRYENGWHKNEFYGQPPLEIFEQVIPGEYTRSLVQEQTVQ